MRARRVAVQDLLQPQNQQVNAFHLARDSTGTKRRGLG